MLRELLTFSAVSYKDKYQLQLINLNYMRWPNYNLTLLLSALCTLLLLLCHAYTAKKCFIYLFGKKRETLLLKSELC